MAERYQLYVQEGPDPGRVIVLDRDEMRLGRSPLLDIVLDDPEVSRQQAIFTRTGAGFTVQDSGSTNGTFVDGRRLAGEPVLLQPGTTIRIGSGVTLLFQEAPEEAASPLDALLDESRARLDEVGAAFEEPDDPVVPDVLTLPDVPERDVPPASDPVTELAEELPPPQASAPPITSSLPPLAEKPPATTPLHQEAPPGEDGGSNRRNIILIAVGLIVLAICCCILLSVLLILSAEGQIDVPALAPTWVLLEDCFA